MVVLFACLLGCLLKGFLSCEGGHRGYTSDVIGVHPNERLQKKRKGVSCAKVFSSDACLL
jgi:hypothetical protein